MAIRTDASGDYIRRTANLPASTSFTLAFWTKWTERAGQFQYLGLEGASDFIQVGISDLGDFDFYVNGPNSQGAWGTGSTPSDGQWWFGAISNSGTGASSAQLRWLRFGVDATFNADTMTGINFTPTALYIGNNSFDEWLDGVFAAVKLWNASLTDAELYREVWRIVPSKFTDLNAWWPMFGGATERLRDYGPNARNLTAGGILTDEGGPPVSWGRSWVITPSFISTGLGEIFATARGVGGSQNDAVPLATSLSTARGFSRGLGIANYYGGVRAHRILAHGQYWAALDAFTEGHYTANIAAISSIARAYGGSLAIAIPAALEQVLVARGFGDTRNKAASTPSLTNIAYGTGATRNLIAFLVSPTTTALAQGGAQNDAAVVIDLSQVALGQGNARNLTDLLVSIDQAAYGFGRTRNRAVPFTPGVSVALGQTKGRGSFVSLTSIASGAIGNARAINVASPAIAISNTALGQGDVQNIVAILLNLIAIARGDSKGLGSASPSAIPPESSAASGFDRGRGSFVSLTTIATGAAGNSPAENKTSSQVAIPSLAAYGFGSGLAGTLLSGIVYVVIGDYIILFPDTDIDVLFPDDEGDILFPDDEINILFGG